MKMFLDNSSFFSLLVTLLFIFPSTYKYTLSFLPVEALLKYLKEDQIVDRIGAQFGAQF